MISGGGAGAGRDEGRLVLTDLIFPAPDATGVALISEGGPTGPASLDLWNL